LVQNNNDFVARNPLAKLKIVHKLWIIVNQIQDIGVAHSDITPGNILI
jgi:tRNA A-37 threonylcarbamoyl transferase component Bud32